MTQNTIKINGKLIPKSIYTDFAISTDDKNYRMIKSNQRMIKKLSSRGHGMIDQYLLSSQSHFRVNLEIRRFLFLERPPAGGCWDDARMMDLGPSITGMTLGWQENHRFYHPIHWDDHPTKSFIIPHISPTEYSLCQTAENLYLLEHFQTWIHQLDTLGI